ncbi:hypothetical protein BJ508DRAFT_377351 [Ascobolus immersus RN42]|uniref:F-box domain-containing protein n=1 Tax=Ascobolus immersus RN42 TaxID=1160509 RepID=A0A3N4I1I4_ASCIM|nr:hypothetical protein BJ508DRAFT_377351 [Ascobolus immersus RN42]
MASDTPHEKACPANDIISRLPLDITYQVLSNISDVEKIKITRVCKSWKQSVENWNADHTRVVHETYPTLIPAPTPEWEQFYQAVKFTTLEPSSTPSGVLQAKSARARIITTKKYSAWIDEDELFTCVLGSSSTIRGAIGKLQNRFSERLAALLDGSLDYSGEVLHIDDDSGIALIAVRITSHREVQRGGEIQVIPVTVLAGFIGFSIPGQRIEWITDTKGQPSDLKEMKKAAKDASPNWSFEYRFNTSSYFLNFTDGLFILISDDFERRTFQLWELDFTTGIRRCIQEDLLYHPLFSFTKETHTRFEPTYDDFNRDRGAEGAADLFRGHFYKADHFDFKRLPFKNQDGLQVYAAVVYSFDLTGADFGPFGRRMPGHPEFQTPLGMEKLFKAAHELLQPLLRRGRVPFDMGVVQFLQHISHADNSHLLLTADDPLELPALAEEAGVDLAALQAMTLEEAMSTFFGQPSPDGRFEKPVECSRSFLLIFNTTTGELIHHLDLKPYQVPLNVGRSPYGGMNDEIAGLLAGVHHDKVRYPAGMQLRIRNDVDDDKPMDSTVGIDVVQYTDVSNVRPYRGSYTASIPESWSLTIRCKNTGQDGPIFTFENRRNCLYKVVFHQSHGHYAHDHSSLSIPNYDNVETVVINPLYQVGLYMSAVPKESDFFAEYDHFNPDNQAAQDEMLAEYNHFNPDNQMTHDEFFADDLETETPIQGPRPPYVPPKDIPSGSNMLAEIIKFDEDKSRHWVSGQDNGNAWEHKWMNVVARKPIYLPMVEGEEHRMRAAWKLKWVPEKCHHEISEAIELDQDGIKLGGMWLWN